MKKAKPKGDKARSDVKSVEGEEETGVAQSHSGEAAIHSTCINDLCPRNGANV